MRGEGGEFIYFVWIGVAVVEGGGIVADTRRGWRFCRVGR